MSPEPRNVQTDVDRILEAIVYLYTESRRVTKELARQHGLTGPQVTALKILEGFGTLSLSELGARMSAKSSTVTGLVDRMERDGLVRRRRSREDRRVIRLEPTSAGQAVAAAIPVTAMEIFGEALRSLSGEDRAELTRILGKLAERVREQIESREGLGG
ncbi:MAG: MarR family transcriptional regulator [Sandaracinaceae bacterium]|nr:MarR family transcriptional regulator [Sandaracinaceae bacterium]